MRSVLRLCLAHALLRGADGRPEESHRDVVLVLHGYDAVLPRFDAALETWLRGWTGRVVFVADHALAFHNGTARDDRRARPGARGTFAPSAERSPSL